MDTIIFCGTPEFAVPPLEQLLKRTDIKVAAVITQPDKVSGRHHSTHTSPPVKKVAEKAGITVLQPIKLADCREKIKEMQPTIGIVVAYGQKIPETLLTIPRYGWINIHASLLPKYRGASPIQSALLHGDEKTGVSLMQIEKGMDTGAIFAQKEILITKEDTTETLHEKLAKCGATLLDEFLSKIITNRITPVVQNKKNATQCLKITKEGGLINFKTQAAEEISNKIRALTPWPGCYTFWDGKRIKIHKAEIQKGIQDGQPGTVIKNDKTIAIICKKDLLIPLVIQKEGKKAVLAEEFLRGNTNFNGAILTASS